MPGDLDDEDEDEDESGGHGVAQLDDDSGIEDGLEAWKLPRSRRRTHRGLLVNASSRLGPRSPSGEEGSAQWWQDLRAKLERVRIAQESRGLVRTSGEAGFRDQARHQCSIRRPSSPAGPVQSLVSPSASRETQHSQTDY